MGPNMFQYLIYMLPNTNSGTIMALVYVLGIIWNNIAVVKDLTTWVGIGPAIVWSGIFRITVFTQVSLGTEIFWIMLAAFSIDHARSIWEFRTTGTMHHALCNSGIKKWVSD